MTYDHKVNGQVVTTENSVYLLDYRENPWTLTRYPRPEHDAEVRRFKLRRDGEAIPVLTIATLKVGEPAVFELAIVEGLTIVRTTSPVLGIEEIW